MPVEVCVVVESSASITRSPATDVVSVDDTALDVARRVDVASSGEL